MIRCMIKYPQTVPSELTIAKFRGLVKQLKGFSSPEDPEDCVVSSILTSWADAYSENLDKITYDNVSSYEP